ncbi:MAG: serine hydrolase [Candidatus Moranbacteria bacterium]|nr:serine hydrolase [Candidatus Moranbacteria bacterium]
MQYRKPAIFAAIFAAGIVIGVFVAPFVPKKISEEETTSKQVRQIGSYDYINPLLECEVAEGSLDARKENFQNDLEQYIDQLKKSKNLSDVAVYFRDLNNGPTFSAGEREEFFPASLLKVPVMMAYYRWSEDEPSLLQQKIAYQAPKDFGVTTMIKPREELTVGQSYTIEELIHRMIIYSDNQAIGLLTERLSLEKMRDLFAMLGVGDDVLSDPNARLTVKEYASFFRILFNSSYLSRENSEKALKLLAATDYSDALPAGVPEGILVAHKFGEAGTAEVERQLHDCGIVYFPNHPYLACIMTRGKDTETLKNALRDISGFIYQKIDEQY